MRERKTPSTFPQTTHRVPHPQAQCLPRGAGGEVGVSRPGGTSVWAPAPVWPGRGEGGMCSQAERPVR